MKNLEKLFLEPTQTQLPTANQASTPLPIYEPMTQTQILNPCENDILSHEHGTGLKKSQSNSYNLLSYAF